MIGRTAGSYAPDISLTNVFISSKHAVIRKEGNAAVLYDLGSRNGTEINGVRAVPHTPYRLQSSDVIQLAKGLAVIHFSYMFDEHTLEFEPIDLSLRKEESHDRPVVNWEKRECMVGGNKIAMSEKEYLLLKLLHDHIGRLVSIRDIKQAVWTDRSPGPDGVPDVSLDELNALIYRIRKKYGKHTFEMIAIRGSGYMLEEQSKHS